MTRFLSIARLLAVVLTLTAAGTAVAQQEPAPKIDVALGVRADFEYQHPKDGKGSSGFHGSYLNLMIKGDLTSQLSYSFRQRLNKFKDLGNDVFSATDWVYLSYKPTKNWVLSGGKQIVAVGGYEYDAAPIDIYYSSIFWQNIACYQFGVSGAYVSNDGNHSLLFQFCNSPYQRPGQSCFAYNLMWSGKAGCWSALWSTNLMEYQRGRFAEYVMLGNRFDLGAVTLDVDLMSRHYEGGGFLDNYSIIAKADWRINEAVNLFAKGGYERLKNDALTTVRCRKPFASVGVETRPIKKYRGVRFHAVYGLTTYEGDFQHNAMAGVTWNCKVFSLTR